MNYLFKSNKIVQKNFIFSKSIPFANIGSIEILEDKYIVRANQTDYSIPRNRDDFEADDAYFRNIRSPFLYNVKDEVLKNRIRGLVTREVKRVCIREEEYVFEMADFNEWCFDRYFPQFVDMDDFLKEEVIRKKWSFVDETIETQNCISLAECDAYLAKKVPVIMAYGEQIIREKMGEAYAIGYKMCSHPQYRALVFYITENGIKTDDRRYTECIDGIMGIETYSLSSLAKYEPDSEMVMHAIDPDILWEEGQDDEEENWKESIQFDLNLFFAM